MLTKFGMITHGYDEVLISLFLYLLKNIHIFTKTDQIYSQPDL